MVGEIATHRGDAEALSCGEALIHLLEQYGVSTVFGIPGVHTLEAYRGLTHSSIRHVLCRHEQGAGFAADGWGRVSGAPGVCLVISGPGVTNVLTPVGQTYHDSKPLLVISGAVSAESHGRGPIHDLPDQRALTAELTAFSHRVEHPQELPEVLARAFEVFECGRPRPVHIAVPVDVLSQATPATAADRERSLPAPGRRRSRGRGSRSALPRARARDPAWRWRGGCRAPMRCGSPSASARPSASPLTARARSPPHTPLSGRRALVRTGVRPDPLRRRGGGGRNRVLGARLVGPRPAAHPRGAVDPDRHRRRPARHPPLRRRGAPRRQLAGAGGPGRPVGRCRPRRRIRRRGPGGRKRWRQSSGRPT